MPARILTATRTAMAQAIITALGNGAQVQLWSGTVPTGLGTPAGTLLATGTWTGVPIGTATAGGIDIDEAGITQSNGSHVNGTPTFARIRTSGGTAHIDIAIGAGSDEWDFTGTVANGQNVTFTGLSLTMPNATA
jgi:hypothetical protein